MTLNVRELEVFRHVMELGSVTAAAAALHVSQPAVSRTLQQAERELGFPLFIRRKKKLIPTAEAEALLPDTVTAFEAIESAQRRARDLRAGISGALNVAAIPAFAHALAPRTIHRFLASRPMVAVTLQSVSAREVARRVARTQADVGLIIDTVAEPGTSVTDLCRTPFGCVIPRGHRLARLRSVTPRDLERERLICLSRNLPLGVQAARTFADADVPLRVAIEVSQSTIACALVQAGAGIALLDGLGLMSAPSDGLVLRPFRPAVEIVGRLVEPRDRPPSRLAQEFVKELNAVIASTRFVTGRAAPRRIRSPAPD